MKKNVAVLMCVYSSEHDISIKSGNTVYNNIDTNNFLVRENGYLFDLKNYNSSIEKIINEIQSDIHNKKLYS